METSDVETNVLDVSVLCSKALGFVLRLRRVAPEHDADRGGRFLNGLCCKYMWWKH
ncbi:uncharacterized protein V6R79_006000 [Siganus canaliculatus]